MSTIKTNAILDAAGGNTATVNGTLIPASGVTLVSTDASQTLTNKTLTSPTINGATISGSTMSGSTVNGGTIARGTAWTYSTPVSSVDFTGIPSWAKRVTVILNGVSTNGTALPLVQVGAGSIVTTGYISSAATSTNSPSSATTGILLAGTNGGGAAIIYSTVLTLVNISSNTWVASTCGGCTNFSASFGPIFGGGTTPNLSGSLDRIRLTTTGTDTFDAGSVNIMWEG